MTRVLPVLAWILLMTSVIVLPVAVGQEAKTQEHYSAVLAAVGGVAGGGTIPLDIRIHRYVTDAEVMKFAELLKEKGPNALRLALEKENVGQISPLGEIGAPIAIARSLRDGNTRVIRIFIARDVSFLEARNAGRSMDYPFSIVELRVNEKGQGEGSAIAAAKIRYNAKSQQFEVESLGQGSSVLKLMNVQRYDKYIPYGIEGDPRKQIPVRPESAAVCRFRNA